VVCVSGMDRLSAGVAAGKVRKPDGRHSKSGQDMAAGVSSHERVSVRPVTLQIRLQTYDKMLCKHNIAL